MAEFLEGEIIMDTDTKGNLRSTPDRLTMMQEFVNARMVLS